MKPEEQIQALASRLAAVEQRLQAAERQLAALQHITVRTPTGEGFAEYSKDNVAIRIVS
jgi:hypothetical protein